MVQVISQTAIQEFKVGSAERGRSMFESCLRNYPARLDVWSQYLDQARTINPSPPPPPPWAPQSLLLHELAASTFAVCADSFLDTKFQFAACDGVGG